MNDRPTSRLEALAPWLAGAVIALPVALARYPPMADLPLHEAIVGLLRHWNDPSFVPPHVYELNLGQPNQLFYFLILPLAYVFSVSTATKLVVALTLFLLPPAAARLAGYLGSTRWTAVLVAPLGLGWMFYWGLLANTIGLVIFLASLPTLDRMCEEPTAPRVWKGCALMVLLHFAHDLMCLMACGTVVLFTLLAWRGWRQNVARLAPALLVVAIAVVSRQLDARNISKAKSDLPAIVYYGLDHKLLGIPAVLYAGNEHWVRNAIFVACLVPLVLFGIERWRTREHLSLSRPEWLHHFRFEILAAWLVIGYFAAPANLSTTTLIFHRFLPPAWAILTVAAAARRPLAAPWRLPRLLAAFMPLAPVLIGWPRFVYSDQVYKDLDEAIAHMQRNSSYVALELGPENKYWLFSPVTGGGHVVAALGGRGFFDFSESPASPVMLRRDIIWTHIFNRLDAHSYRLYPAYDFTHFRYGILHTPDESIGHFAALACEPEAHEIFHKGEWTIVESTLPQVPVDSPDEPTPEPHPLTLRRRMINTLSAVLNVVVTDDALPPETTPQGISGPK
jgi:hypothetical protein